MTDLNTIILFLAASLFGVALIALTVWGFKTFVFASSKNAGGFLRGRERRLGVVETASVDSRRKLLLIRRDDVEHLIMIGGPVDVLIETKIEGRPHLSPPLGDVVIDRSEARQVPNFGPAEPQIPANPPVLGPMGNRFPG